MDLDRLWAKLPQNKPFLMLRCLTQQYFHRRVGRSAAALAYYMIFSFFPILTLGSSILSFLQLSPDFVTQQLHGILPQEVLGITASFIQHVNENSSGGVFAFSLAFSLYFPMRSVNYLVECISRAYHTGPRRSPWKTALVVAGFTVSLPVVFLVSLVVLLTGENLLTRLGAVFRLDPGWVVPWISTRFLYLAALLFVVLAALYWLAPGNRPPFRQVLPGAALATGALLAISMGFAYYVENMGNYSVVYGSLGAIIVLLLWIYFSSAVLLMGAEWNRALDRLRTGDLPDRRR